MTDPRKLLEDDALPDAERRALAAARAARPPDDVVQGAWTALAAVLPPLPPGTAGAGHGTVTSAAAGATSKVVTLTVLKATVLGALAGGVITAGTLHFTAAPPAGKNEPARTDTAQPPAERPPRSVPTGGVASPPPVITAMPPEVAPRATPAETRTESPGTNVTAQAPDTVASGLRGSLAPTPAAPPESMAGPVAPGAVATFAASPPPSGAMDSMAVASAEARLVGLAREALRAGDASRALAMLEEARFRFPSGVVPQEREALAVEALVQLGRRTAAAARAAAFARDYPNSPHAARVRALVSP